MGELTSSAQDFFSSGFVIRSAREGISEVLFDILTGVVCILSKDLTDFEVAEGV